MHVKYSHKVLNSEQLWTGKYKFFVQFRSDPSGPGGVLYPPQKVTIGKERGYPFSQELPYIAENVEYMGTPKRNATKSPFCVENATKPAIIGNTVQIRLCAMCVARRGMFSGTAKREAKNLATQM